ncbi:tyrosyl-DNA phosphodiesterase 2-like isoform X3 [Gordionus sp. m RMFG-2023]|uniref:tyrosyl-DNA phosphodiesterase 2-like isoform X3 n=1 Tax=Gordionus sp. m RMFG-2023 TaxID=3053472 RepID=UPI0031FD3803
MEENEDDLSVPPVKICEELCQNFAKITKTDTALAQFYLQDRKWDLYLSLNDYFLDNDIEIERKNVPIIEVKKDFHKIITWNLNGLDSKNLEIRSKVICDIVKKENPSLIYLQEVVLDSLKIIEDELSYKYHIILGHDNANKINKLNYFVCTLILKNDYVHILDSYYTPFENSFMGRGVLIVKIEKAMNTQSSPRDLEMVDLWEASGSPMQYQFTYDALYNSNITFPKDISPYARSSKAGNSSIKTTVNNDSESRVKGRLRFDRLYTMYSINRFGILNESSIKDSDIEINYHLKYKHDPKCDDDNRKKMRKMSPIREDMLCSKQKDMDPLKVVKSSLKAKDLVKTPKFMMKVGEFNFVGIEKMIYQDRTFQTPPSDHWGISVMINFSMSDD